MMRKTIKSSRDAQTMLEYSIVLSIVALVFIGMQPFLQRGIQGMIKVVGDQIGNQETADQLLFQGNVIDSQKIAENGGYLLSAYSTTRANFDSRTIEDGAGTTTYIFDDMVDTDSNALINLGFSPQ